MRLGLQGIGLGLAAPVRSSAARAALRSTRLLHLFRANAACANCARPPCHSNSISRRAPGAEPHFNHLKSKTKRRPVFRPRRLLKIWGGRWESNPRQPESQSGALPTELRPPYCSAAVLRYNLTEAWCGRRDSNSYSLRRWNLNPVCLPISPRPRNA